MWWFILNMWSGLVPGLNMWSLGAKGGKKATVFNEKIQHERGTGKKKFIQKILKKIPIIKSGEPTKDSV